MTLTFIPQDAGWGARYEVAVPYGVFIDLLAFAAEHPGASMVVRPKPEGTYILKVRK